MLKLYNELQKKKQKFVPIKEGQIKIYVCGPTVYDSPHIGHARAAVAFDILRRYFIFKGNDVQFVSNYTDVDDKMIDRSNELGIPIGELADKYITEYEENMSELNIMPPDLKPKATNTIDGIQELIGVLVDKGYAYESNGSVYFDVSKLEGYNNIFLRGSKKKKSGEKSGDDANQELNELINDQDTRVSGDFAEEKRNEQDFALWKKTKENEPSWESPWGEGRPGWHIECSAMVHTYMGDEIDIHGGGMDLIFPHHTNEVAQTKAAYGTNLARYWVHNGFVNISGEKMSKSLKNFFTVSEVLKEYDGITLRFFLSTINYRTVINYSLEGLDDAKANLSKIKNFYEMIKSIATSETISKEDSTNLMTELDAIHKKFMDALDDDINTAGALSQIYQIIKLLNSFIITDKKEINAEIKSKTIQILNDFSDIFGIILDDSKLKLGLMGKDKSEFGKLIQEKDDLISSLMNLLVKVRGSLRKKKIFELSDEIRDELKKLGIVLDDMSGKTLWKFSVD